MTGHSCGGCGPTAAPRSTTAARRWPPATSSYGGNTFSTNALRWTVRSSRSPCTVGRGGGPEAVGALLEEPQQFDGEGQHQGRVLLRGHLDDGFEESKFQRGRA